MSAQTISLPFARTCPPGLVRPILPLPEKKPVAPVIAELDAQIIVAGIDHLASAINASWFDLSPEAKARVLELESALSFLRRQFK